MICQHTQQVIIISITLHFLHHGVMIDTPSLARPTHDQSDVTSIALIFVAGDTLSGHERIIHHELLVMSYQCKTLSRDAPIFWQTSLHLVARFRFPRVTQLLPGGGTPNQWVYKSSVESIWSSVRSYFFSSELSPQSRILTRRLGTAVLGSDGTSPRFFTVSCKGRQILLVIWSY